MSCSDIFLGVIAIFFPPLAVWVKAGICSVDSVINICMCILGFIPGVIHAWYIISKFPEETESRTYYLVNGGDEEEARQGLAHSDPSSHREHQPQRPEHQVGYGATGNSSRPQPQNQGAIVGAPPSYTDAVKGDHKVQSGT